MEPHYHVDQSDRCRGEGVEQEPESRDSQGSLELGPPVHALDAGDLEALSILGNFVFGQVEE